MKHKKKNMIRQTDQNNKQKFYYHERQKKEYDMAN